MERKALIYFTEGTGKTYREWIAYVKAKSKSELIKKIRESMEEQQ